MIRMSLLGWVGMVVVGTGCAAAPPPAPQQAQAPAGEPVVLVETPESGMLPGTSEWEWTPPERTSQSSTEQQVMPTSLRAQKSSMGQHLNKRLPKHDGQ